MQWMMIHFTLYTVREGGMYLLYEIIIGIFFFFGGGWGGLVRCILPYILIIDQ